jgi:hypothetical protein
LLRPRRQLVRARDALSPLGTVDPNQSVAVHETHGRGVGALLRRSSCKVRNVPRCASSTNCHSTFARSASVSARASRRYLCARVSALVGVIRGPVWQSGMANNSKRQGQRSVLRFATIAPAGHRAVTARKPNLLCQGMCGLPQGAGVNWSSLRSPLLM